MLISGYHPAGSERLCLNVAVRWRNSNAPGFVSFIFCRKAANVALLCQIEVVRRNFEE